MRKAALRLTPEEELADLQRKHAQLENDRKAYYETSQWTIKQNAATLSGAQARRGPSAERSETRRSRTSFAAAAPLLRFTLRVLRTPAASPGPAGSFRRVSVHV